jgi:UDPglucose 6-dehydrogenase
MSEREPIGVIGTGWVGLVTAACFAELGHRVVARDIVAEKVAALERGEVPIHEPGLAELIERNRERLEFTTEIEPVLDAARLIFICVQTPPTHSGDADLSAVMRAVEEIGGGEQRAVVMKSTVPVGTGRRIRSLAEGLAYVSCPEFLREGTAVKDFLEPDRVVIGVQPGDEWAAEAVAAAYEAVGAPIVRTDVSSAEMIKLASNAFLATKISFINEIANVSEEVGADVTEVARGMGMDDRIGPRFLQAGIGYGGSCLVGEETVLVRRQGRVWMWTLADLFALVADEQRMDAHETGVLFPEELEVLAWRKDSPTPEFLPVSAATRRRWDGEILEVKTKMGRRVSCTPDHPFVVADRDGQHLQVKEAEELCKEDWLPLAQGAADAGRGVRTHQVVLSGMIANELQGDAVIVRLGESDKAQVSAASLSERRRVLADHPRGHAQRSSDIRRSGALHLDEAQGFGLSLRGARAATARSGTYVPFDIEFDERFWRVAGLYIAEGHCSIDGPHKRHRLQWSFHPEDEMDLVDEVADYWRDLGVKATVRRMSTAMAVSVSSKLLARWWLDSLGMGANCYEQRIPNAAWQQSLRNKRALLSGMWLGDGSWSYVSDGPSVVLEYGTASLELADGLLRLLGDVGVVAGLRVGRTKKSTTDNYWIRISGAEQIERAIYLAPENERAEIKASLARGKRIAPTGYRRHDTRSAAWVRVVGTQRRPFTGDVFSLEVPGAETFVTTGGLVSHNCFPKDVSALKILAGNSGYHFQLLNSVIEVNELQKRRVLSKLTKHLGSLSGKRVALLGLAFKADTDDMREASSLVLASRLEGEGATVVAYDPVAEERAKELLSGVEMSQSALQALDGADAAVLVTEWPEFAELDWAEVAKRMATALLVDGRNFLDAEAMRAAGFTYEGIGRPSAEDGESPG